MVEHILDSGLPPLANRSIAEDSHTELKGAFSFNRRSGAKDKDLQLGCLRTIAGFLNSEGGTLLIGINDDGTISGIDDEARSLFPDRHLDQYALMVEEAIKKSFVPLPLSKVTVGFEMREGRWACLVKVTAAQGLTYLKEDQVGEKVMSIYVRTGNRTTRLKDIDRDAFVAKRTGGSWQFGRHLA